MTPCSQYKHCISQTVVIGQGMGTWCKSDKSKRFHSGIFIGAGEEGYPLVPQIWEEGPISGCRTKRRKKFDPGKRSVSLFQKSLPYVSQYIYLLLTLNWVFCTFQPK